MTLALSRTRYPRLEVAWFCLIGLYLFGLILGDRAFSYWHAPIGSMPLYVTEFVLVMLIGGMMFGIVTRPTTKLSMVERAAWLVFFLAAFQSAVRGFLHQPLADVLRDSAIAYYGAFFFIARWAASDEEHLLRLAGLTTVALAGKIILGGIQLVALPPWSSQPAAMCMYFSIFILASFALASAEGRLMLPLAVVSGLAGGLLFLYQVRTSWVGFLMGAAVLLLLLRPSLRRAHLRFAAVAMAIAIMMPSAWKALDRDRVAGSMDEIHTFGVLLNQPGAIVNEAFRPKPAAPPPSTPTAIPISKTEEKPVAAIEEKPLIETQASLGTSRTRLWMWGDMITELKNDGTWVLGVPMGKPWLPPRIVPWWNLKVTKRIDPHNSFLAMLYRTGIFGLGAFGVIVLSVIIRAIRAARKLPEDSVDRLLVAAAVAGAVYCLGHAATDVTFENPFKGLFVWLMLGVASALTREN